MNRSSIVPYTLAGLDEALGKSANGVVLHVTVKTALVTAPSNTVVKVEDHELIKPSAPVTLKSMKYYTIVNGNYDCG
ncbi:hypothetical protein [Arthrobacter sp. ZGTC212]|uniref:hypothetical protein n=1 Tax=Arthrobacter sp. ZGTC212 TaxID=2058899 RepID=UPI000CE39E0C|nr:hypothetical protein [Arthrobacter sp. ZGTC212]